MAVLRKIENSKSDFLEGELNNVEVSEDGILQLKKHPILNFNGSNTVIKIPEIEAFNLQTLTISVWVFFLDNSNNFIFEKGDCNTQYSLFSHGDDIVFRTKPVGEAYDTLSDTKVNLGVQNNKWVHLCATFDGQTKKVYIDGIEKLNRSWNKTIEVNNNDCSIGRFGGTTTGYYFTGKIKDLKIFNRALSSEEVLIEKEADSFPEGLIAYYKLNEGAGLTITDSINQYNGTLSNGIWNLNYSDGYRISPLISLSEIDCFYDSKINWEELNEFSSLTTNVALNKPVSCNGTVSGDLNYITNGNLDTGQYVSVSASDIENIVIDLEEIFTLNQIKVFHYYSDGRTYYSTKTEVSEDGENWTTIFDSAIEGTYPETSSGKQIFFEPQKVRYIRDYLNGSTKNGGSHWVEIQAFEPLQETFTFVETRFSYDEGLSWTQWQAQEKNSNFLNFPPKTDLKNLTIQYKQKLPTLNENKTPKVSFFEIEIKSSIFLPFKIKSEEKSLSSCKAFLIDPETQEILDKKESDLEGKLNFEVFEKKEYFLIFSPKEKNVLGASFKKQID